MCLGLMHSPLTENKLGLNLKTLYGVDKIPFNVTMRLASTVKICIAT